VEQALKGTSKTQTRSDRRRGRWTRSELKRLRELYGMREDAAIARTLKRPVDSVRRMAESVCRAPARTGPWSAQEVQQLKACLGRSTPEIIARILGRELREVNERIIDLGRIQRSGRWKRDEVAEFKRVYGTRTDEDIARIFGRSLDSVQRMASQLALSKDKAFLRKAGADEPTRMPRWTEDEFERLRELYPLHANLEIAKRLQRSVKSVVSKAHHLGLKKEPERLQEMGRANVRLRYKG
jgi:hypothetical protein